VDLIGVIVPLPHLKSTSKHFKQIEASNDGSLHQQKSFIRKDLWCDPYFTDLQISQITQVADFTKG